MPLEDDADRAALLVDVGDSATFTPAAGGPLPVVGMFDAASEYVSELGTEREVSMVAPTLLCRKIDVPGVAIGDAIELLTGEGVGTYDVVDYTPAWGDGAFTRLILQES